MHLAFHIIISSSSCTTFWISCVLDLKLNKQSTSFIKIENREKVLPISRQGCAKVTISKFHEDFNIVPFVSNLPFQWKTRYLLLFSHDLAVTENWYLQRLFFFNCISVLFCRGVIGIIYRIFKKIIDTISSAKRLFSWVNLIGNRLAFRCTFLRYNVVWLVSP